MSLRDHPAARLFSIRVFLALMAFTSLQPRFAAAYSGGDGSAGNPYQIASKADLLAMAADTGNYDKCFILTADIDLDPNLPGGEVFTAALIAQDTSASDDFQGTPFVGVFDGNGHTISDLTIAASAKEYIGLFGYIGSGSQIRDLGVEDVNIIGRNNVGGLVGANAYGTLTSCYATGSVSGTGGVGGLVGGIAYGTLTSCYAAGSVNGNYSVGGLVGYNWGTLISCHATGSVAGTDDFVGGLVGRNNGTLTTCYATDSVSGIDSVGGLVGCNTYSSLTTCYATGSVTGTGDSVGGLVGDNASSTLTACHATGSVVGNYSVGGLAGMSWFGSTLTDCSATGSVVGNDSVGGLGGIISDTLTDCYATGPVTGSESVGGLAGEISYATLTTCYATGSVSATGQWSYVGGLGGDNESSTLTACHATGSVSGTSVVGGLVGLSGYGSTLTDCYATGSVSGSISVGGLVGSNYAEGTVTDCYAAGSVSGGWYVGGLVGSNWGTLTACYATGSVSGIYIWVGGLVGENLGGTITVTGNYATGIVDGTAYGIGELVAYSDVPIIVDGNIPINSSNGVHSPRWKDLVIQGSGTLDLSPDVTLDLGNSTISCDIAGQGSVRVDSGTELKIVNSAHVNLPVGGIQCDGLLHVKDNVTIRDTHIQVTRLKFEGDVDIANSVVTAEAGSPYGQFFIDDTVTIADNEIHADGDRYMDLDPSVFAGLIANNTIYVTITEGVGSTRGGLIELRGDPNLAGVSYPSDDFFCYLENIPAFSTHSWTLEELTLVPGAKVNLTNRFDFGNGRYNEVLYVKKLTLGANCQLNTAFNRLYYGQLVGEPNCIENKPLLGFSLSNVACHSDNEFVSRIVHNNFIDTDSTAPDHSRIHVSRITGASPDPNGMIRMRDLTDTDPESSTYNQVIDARAKALFAKANEDEIYVIFDYLFATDEPGTRLDIYLTDVPELLAPNDPGRAAHYTKVGELLPPPEGRPGAVGSGRFGRYQAKVSRGSLDFTRGTRIEFELVGPVNASIYIDNWDPQVHCNRLYCKDVTGDWIVNEKDFLTVVGGTGLGAGLLPDGTSNACLDGVLSSDGYLDNLDTTSSDWTLKSSERLNLCSLPLTPGSGGSMSARAQRLTRNLLSGGQAQMNSQSFVPSANLVVMGKRSATDLPGKMLEHLYQFNSQTTYAGSAAVDPNRCGLKLLTDAGGNVCELNADTGLTRLSDGLQMLANSASSVTSDPRYHTFAQVYVGLQQDGGDYAGRPVLDACFDSSGYLYVVPVIVAVSGHPAYFAGAKLQLNPGQSPAYTIVRLFDNPPATSDNLNRTGLREIEVDGSNHVYMANAYNLNESDFIEKYDATTGALLTTKNLSTIGIKDPAALCLASNGSWLYVASGQNVPGAMSTMVYRLAASDLHLDGTVSISNMGHVSGMTEDPSTHNIWVAGFTMPSIPDIIPDGPFPPFYCPFMAKIQPGQSAVDAATLSLAGCDLAMPMSVVWASPAPKCGGADIDLSGTVNARDFGSMAQYWRNTGCGVSGNCSGRDLNRDGSVDMKDLAILAQYWLATSCQ